VTEVDLKKRTKSLALRVMKLVDALPSTTTGRAIASQLIRSGTSVGANYRAAWRGRSKAEFVAKLGIVEEEADETAYWLELIVEGELLTEGQVQALWKEANEITPAWSPRGRRFRSRWPPPATPNRKRNPGRQS
jgi:four helix bundle protein